MTMKNPTIKMAVRQTLNLAILACVLVAGSLTASYAAETPVAKTSPVELKYIGQVNEQPVFEVNIDNSKGENLFLNLEDEDNNVLYTDKFNDKSFSKKFQFAMSEAGSTKITMNLFTKDDKKTQVFEIKNVAQVVQNVVVTKVD